ncbi:MAG: nucleoside triphosphate diphosphatase [Gaiellales bacterium]|jgi:MazG family protein|nr:nucleoside triphosphate diphosphatase [Gaiellales bacterium]
MAPCALIVALGPGEPELVPAAALEALRRAGSAAPRDLPDALRASLIALGIRLEDGAPTVCAPDGAAHAIARSLPGTPTLPERPLLARQAAQAAAGALLELTALLRRECPWDRAQTATSIVPHTVEEAYEVADAVREAGLSPKLLDELGDLLFQTTFLALLCEEAGAGAWVDVALGVAAKLRLRHPWVFGVENAESAGEARNLWEDVKVESEGREGIFHDVPRALPALLQARKVQRRAAAIGFEYATTADAFGDLESELRELRSELGDEPEPEREPLSAIVGEIGDVLFACVNVARRYNCDPELALRAATARFRERVECAERLAEAEGVVFRAAGTPEQEHYYQAAKQSLREGK